MAIKKNGNSNNDNFIIPSSIQKYLEYKAKEQQPISISQRSSPPIIFIREKEEEKKHSSIIPYLVSIFLVVLVALAFINLWVMISPANKKATVISFSWERRVLIEELVQVKESGWELPEGATLLYSQEEIKYLHNPSTMPMMGTRFSYLVNRWVTESTVMTSGDNKEPYWGTVTLSDQQRTHGLEVYYVTLLSHDGEIIKLKVPYLQWETMEVGQEVVLNGEIIN